MRKAIFMIMIFGIVTSQSFAQKKATNVVCFKSSMDCENCQTTLTEYLKFEKGVSDLKVDLSTNTVMIKYKEGKNSEEQLAKAIEKKGYEAKKISTDEYHKMMKETETGQKGDKK